MKHINAIKRFMAAGAIVAAGAIALAGCSSGGDSKKVTVSDAKALSSYEKADMSGYEVANIGQGDSFVKMTVKDMKKEMEAGSSFAILFGYNSCEWCNRLLPTLNETAKEIGTKVGYVDTRASSAWRSNLDIDDYDELVELVGDRLSLDSDGIKHLYVPQIFFIKDGVLVDDHSGVVNGYDSPDDDLTQEQKDLLKETLKEKFAEI